uniref:Uncharacterized protein n=2 Tax=Clytia hemisphaerica TaxID=252671 RepID=A0A7M5XD93_9CNID
MDCGRILPSKDQKETWKGGDCTVKWTLKPSANEKADWITVYHQADENEYIKPIWEDVTGKTTYGRQKFMKNQTLSVNVQKNEIEIVIGNIQESMILYLTAVFLNKDGEMKDGPLQSKVTITISSGMKIKNGTLIKTFDKFYPRYEVSFEIKPYGLTPWSDTSILDLTTGVYDPSVLNVRFISNSTTLYICSRGSWCYIGKEDLTTEKYTHIDIKQSKTQNQTYFVTIATDGTEVYRKVNIHPENFTNVKVYQSSPMYTPAKAFIRNLKIITKP